MKVTATQDGFIYGIYRKKGVQFECAKEDFSSKWMEMGEVVIPEPVITHANVKKEVKVNSYEIELPKLDIARPKKLTPKKS